MPVETPPSEKPLLIYRKAFLAALELSQILPNAEQLLTNLLTDVSNNPTRPITENYLKGLFKNPNEQQTQAILQAVALSRVDGKRI